MTVLDRFRRRWASKRLGAGEPVAELPGALSVAESGHRPGERSGDRAVPAGSTVDSADEAELWGALRENPNDVEAFPRLAEIVRRHAGERSEGGDQKRAADDAVWSLAEELAHSPKAWFPLVELARLSVHDDREAALRRLGTATDRDPSGRALATGLAMLREEHMPGDALNLGVGHWRPREHVLDVGRQLVEAAVECGRIADAQRHLLALETHPDQAAVARLRAELEPLIALAQASLPPGTPAGGLPMIDLRDLRELRSPSTRSPFRRR